MRRSVLLPFVLILIFYNGFSQSINPGEDEIFIEDEIAVFELTMSKANKDFLLDPDNAYSEQYVPADIRMVNSKIDSVRSNIGIRLRGNTSRGHLKKSFKIDFREFGGSKFLNFKKFNLKPNVNDPTFIREFLTMRIYRQMDVPAARTHFLKLYMNGEYMGLYLNVEQVDDEFVDTRFGNESGNLYKCTYGANLLNDGQIYDNGIYEIKTNEEIDDRIKLSHFVDVLNNSSNQEFKIEIEKVFDVGRYIKQLAVESLLGHWDGYSYNQNNYYLYENPDNGLIEFIPYDTDNTWGIDWVQQDWGYRDLNYWFAEGGERPLSERILNVPEYNRQYVQYLFQLLEGVFSESVIFPVFDNYEELLKNAVLSDPFYSEGFGFTMDDYFISFETGLGGHVQYGLKEYVDVRTGSALMQIEKPVAISDKRNGSKDLVVFPNPLTGSYLMLQTNKKIDTGQLKLMNSLGQDIETEILDQGSNKYRIDFNNAVHSRILVLIVGNRICKILTQ